jgi:H-type lectin domain
MRSWKVLIVVAIPAVPAFLLLVPFSNARGQKEAGAADAAQSSRADPADDLRKVCATLAEENRRLAESIRELRAVCSSLARSQDSSGTQKDRADRKNARPRVQLGRARVPLQDGAIPRETVFQIAFKESFPDIPEVFVALGGFDITGHADGDATAVRIHATAENITKTGFALRVKTWHQSELSGFEVTWIAADPAIVGRETVLPHASEGGGLVPPPRGFGPRPGQ